MFRHIVMFRWGPASSEEQRAALRDALAGLPDAIPQLRRYVFGDDAGINEGNLDFGLVAEFDDAEGYIAYREHPEHLRIIVELINPYLDSRSVVQFDSAD